MAPIWLKHGPNMVLLIGHNIDMSMGPISLSPESFISLACLESHLQVRVVNYPLTYSLTDTSISRVVPLWGATKNSTRRFIVLLVQKSFALAYDHKSYEF